MASYLYTLVLHIPNQNTLDKLFSSTNIIVTGIAFVNVTRANYISEYVMLLSLVQVLRILSLECCCCFFSLSSLTGTGGAGTGKRLQYRYAEKETSLYRTVEARTNSTCLHST